MPVAAEARQHRLRIVLATKGLKATASDAVKSAPNVEATTAELAARRRADSAMHALLAEVGLTDILPYSKLHILLIQPESVAYH